MAILEPRFAARRRALEGLGGLAFVAVLVAAIRVLRGAPIPAAEPDHVWNSGAPWPPLDTAGLPAAPPDGRAATPTTPTRPTSADAIDLRVDQTIPSPPSSAEPVGGTGERPTVTLAVAWVEPFEGECPPGYPIKAKLGSGIYHRPGGALYGRTRPDRCYASAEAAEADGLRAAKR